MAESCSGLFWCNDDHDTQDDLEDGEPLNGPIDSADNEIKSLRDLEDFTRLHLYIGGLQEAVANGNIQVGLEWRNTTGNPSIKIYRAAEPNGGDKYLRNDSSEYYGVLQTAVPFKTALGTINGAGGFKFPSDFWQSTGSGIPAFDADHPTRYILFEGVTEGKGQLVMTFWKNNQKIGEGGACWLDIKQIKKMYQRWDSASGHPWAPDEFEEPLDEPKQDAIIFVHGWKMSPEGAGNFAETMFKRLWHRGFKGRFVAYHWDTWWFDSWQWVNDLAGVDVGAALAHYNDSEYIAWQGAASSLKNYVNNLPFQNKNIVAHSMGNIVVGEALRQGMTVKNYAMLNAAVPAACYDEDQSRIEQTTIYNHTTKLLGATVSIPMWDDPSPDGDLDAPTKNLAYRGTLKDIGNNATLINFYLPDDFATSVAWEINNDVTKGPSTGAPLNAGFEYDPGALSGQKLYKYNLLTGTKEYDLIHKPEAMAYACRTWGKAVGAFGATQGAILPANKVDMSNPANVGGGAAGFDKEHSAQFNFRIQQLKPFYNMLLDRFNLSVNP